MKVFLPLFLGFYFACCLLIAAASGRASCSSTAFVEHNFQTALGHAGHAGALSANCDAGGGVVAVGGGRLFCCLDGMRHPPRHIGATRASFFRRCTHAPRATLRIYRTCLSMSSFLSRCCGTNAVANVSMARARGQGEQGEQDDGERQAPSFFKLDLQRFAVAALLT